MPASLTDRELSTAVAQLPPVSSVLNKLLTVLNDPDSDLDDVARLVRSETALAAQVLRMANSALFALPEPASSVSEAIQRLGALEVHAMVAALASRQLVLRSLAAYGISAERLWQHALTVAVAAETIALNTGADRALAYLAGILHPVGMMALDRVAAARRMPPQPDDVSMPDWERQHFGTTNAAVASYVLTHWNFPVTLSLAVLGRYEPNSAENAVPEARILYAASCIAVSINAGLDAERGLFRATPEAIEASGLKWDEYSEVAVESGQRLLRAQTMLNLA